MKPHKLKRLKNLLIELRAVKVAFSHGVYLNTANSPNKKMKKREREIKDKITEIVEGDLK